MTGSPEVIAGLAAALPGEAHLNLQYRLYTRLLKFMGVKKTAAKMSEYAGDAHGFLKSITKQLLFLSGENPSAVAYSVGTVAEPNPPTVTQLFTEALAAEMAICSGYEALIPMATAARDDETRNLAEHLVKFHHHHVRWIEKQIRLITAIGEADYITDKL